MIATQFPPPPPPVFLDLADLGARWGCSPSTLRRRIRRGQLQGSRPAGRLLVPMDAIVAAEHPFLKAQPKPCCAAEMADAVAV